MTMCVHGFWAGGDDEAVHQSPIAAREVPGLDDLDVQRPLPHCLRLRFRALQVMVNVLPFLRCSGLDVDWGQRSASVRRRERAIRLLFSFGIVCDLLPPCSLVSGGGFSIACPRRTADILRN